MISVSRAAGYGKFTQTNDSHLPEARDTIERGAAGTREGEEEEEQKAEDYCEEEDEEEKAEHSMTPASRREE